MGGEVGVGWGWGWGGGGWRRACRTTLRTWLPSSAWHQHPRFWGESIDLRGRGNVRTELRAGGRQSMPGVGGRRRVKLSQSMIMYDNRTSPGTPPSPPTPAPRHRLSARLPTGPSCSHTGGRTDEELTPCILIHILFLLPVPLAHHPGDTPTPPHYCESGQMVHRHGMEFVHPTSLIDMMQTP